jgi:hypothetical protein
MPTFSGSGFRLESVSQTASTTVRVKFTQDPKVDNAGASDDALNPANYSLAGPIPVFVDSVEPALDDPQCVDLYLSTAVVPATWTVTASSAIVAYDGITALSAPYSLTLVVVPAAMPSPVNEGAVNDAAADLLRKHLNPALKGDAWDAIIAGIATGDQKNFDNAKLAFDQLFKSTASGVYLERHAADDGLTKPQNLGMADELFRQYAVESTNFKLVESALLKILEVFYGSDAVRAYADSAVETYDLNDGDDLIVSIDEGDDISVVFALSDFSNVGRALAVEVASAITRAFRFAGSTAFAIPYTNPQTGLTNVRIYSGSLGLGSSVRIKGGKAQTILQFPELLDTTGSLPTWNLTYVAATQTLRFSPTSTFDCSKVRIGDYVSVYGDPFVSGNRGTFAVTNVYWAYPGGVLTQYFEVVNPTGSAQTGIVQTDLTDLMVFRPKRATIHNGDARAVVVASIGEEVDVVLPATSQAVNRQLNTAAYGQVSDPVVITSVTRAAYNATFTATAHGLQVGDQVVVEGCWGAGAGLNEVFRVNAIPTANTFTVETRYSFTLTAAVTGQFIPMSAPDSDIPGPFVYDTDGVAVTATESTVAEDLDKGHSYATITLADASDFPDADGWLAFDFGYENQVGPVRYLGRRSDTTVALDASFRFPKTIPSGSTVILLAQKGPWLPEHPEEVGSFYLTASPAGRVAAEAAIEASTAAGVGLNVSVTYPGDRGLGGEGLPTSGAYKLSDKVSVWGGDDVDAEIEAARENS